MTEQLGIPAEQRPSGSPWPTSSASEVDHGTTSDVRSNGISNGVVEMAQALATRVEDFARREQTDRAERDRLTEQVRSVEEERWAERAQREAAPEGAQDAISDADLHTLVQVIDAAVLSPESLRDLLALSQHTALAAAAIRDYVRLRDQSSPAGSTDAV